ncbi:hypothetical protein NDR87_34220 [Nocardia sp. CDC159]|uniref:HTH cro/C1-type domain-containing protein n=1 Tax=Nocardia pulmonis TaxID=2951408 RepID=A0A9X2EDW2_9NOCA|nr:MULTISPECIES: hypothetical protein [Nocardia]MCM6778551.1 hypothetical protein [Nocardia pulmonis]MCM6791440.1 hypothetical protein [Nocardia sp. CDC159]
MADSTQAPALNDRLRRLFDDIRPAGRHGRRYTDDQVAAAVRAAHPEIRISGAYLSALRTGGATDPTPEVLTALAEFFGVRPGYFADPAIADETDAEIALARILAEMGVRQIALRAARLRPQREPGRAAQADERG